MRIAKKDDNKTLPLPRTTKALPYKRDFALEEMELIRQGRSANRMEEKWFIYLEDDTLHIHRSWTGIQIFQLTLVQVKNHYTAVKTIVNRDPTEYHETDDDFDIKLLDYLIDRELLGKRVDFPRRGYR